MPSTRPAKKTVHKRGKAPPAKSPRPKKPATKATMNETEFWRIISLFNWKKSGDDDDVLAPAKKALASRSEADIFRFADLLAEKLHALDTREHCRGGYAGSLDPDDPDDYISADDFLYLRCCVVANGKKRYEQALGNPKKMMKDLEFEALLYLPTEAYEEKTGKDFPHVPKVDFESFQNKAGWKATPNTKRGRFTSKNIPPGNRRPA